MHRLPRGEDVEGVGIQYQPRRAARSHPDGLPEILHVEHAGLVHVDDAGMLLGPEALQAGDHLAGEIDPQRDAARRHVRLGGVHQAFGGLEAQEFEVRQARNAATEAYLRQARAGAHQDGEGARGDFQIERAVIAGGNGVEGARAIGDDAHEHVQTAGGAFGVRRRRKIKWQLQALEQFHQIDAAGLQHRTLGKVEIVQGEVGQALLHRDAGPRQEARAHPPRRAAEPQVQARRLDLVHIKRPAAGDGTRRLQRRNGLGGQDAGLLMLRRSHGHIRFPVLIVRFTGRNP